MESNNEYVVLTKNKLDDLSTLLIERLPSPTIFGIELKSESMSTSCETLRAELLAFSKVILQSASLRASTSFTPSPT